MSGKRENQIFNGFLDYDNLSEEEKKIYDELENKKKAGTLKNNKNN